MLESTRQSVSLVWLYNGPNYKCLISRVGNLQCLHMVSGSDIPLVLLLLFTRDRKSSHLEAKSVQNRNHSSSEPCSDFSDSPLKARCSEHNILAATHCFGFWNETVLPNTSWPDLVLLSDPHPFPVQKKNDSFTMLNFQWLNKKSNTKFILYNSYHNPPKTWNNPNKN